MTVFACYSWGMANVGGGVLIVFQHDDARLYDRHVLQLTIQPYCMSSLISTREAKACNALCTGKVPEMSEFETTRLRVSIICQVRLDDKSALYFAIHVRT